MGEASSSFTVAKRRLAYLVGAIVPNLWISNVSSNVDRAS